MANKIRGASGLTGGAVGALDSIDGNLLDDGNLAVVLASDDQAYFYVLDADSGATEASPRIISPDTNAGNKRWIRIGPKIDRLTNYADLNTAITAIGATEQTLILDKSTTLTANATIPTTLHTVGMRNCQIDGSYTLTQNGPFEAGLYQVFGSSITVSFGAGAVEKCFVDWFGTNAAAVSSAITAVGSTEIPLHFLGKTYTVTDLDISVSNKVILEGEGDKTILSGGKQFTFATSFIARNMKISNWSNDANKGAFYLNASANVALIDVQNVIFDTMESAIRAPAAGGTPDVSDYEIAELRITGCEFDSIDRYGCRLEMRIQFADIHSNWSHDCGATTGTTAAATSLLLGDGTIVANTKAVSIHDNSFETIQAPEDYECHAVLLYGNLSSITNNHIDGINGAGADHEAIYVRGYGNVVANNEIKDGGVGGNGYICVKGSSTETYGNSVIGNTLHGTDANQLIYANAGTIIEGNTGKTTTSGGGIKVIGSATDYIFGINGNKMNVVGYPLRFTDIQNSAIKGNVFLSSTLEGIRGDKIALSYPAENTIIDANVIRTSGSGKEPIQFDDAVANVDIRNNQCSGDSLANLWPSGSTGRIENNTGLDETVSADAQALNVYGVTYLDSSGGERTGTLADGLFQGQQKLITMSVAGNNFDITIAHHETADDEVARFDAVDEYLLLIWTGTEWATVSNSCTFP